MQFGNLSGLVNGTETVVFDSEVVGAAVSSISTGNILNGDEDGWYTIIVRRIQGSSFRYTLQFNGDTGANYGRRGIQAASTTVGNDSATGEAGIYLDAANNAADATSFSVAKIYAKSGAVRLLNCISATDIATTTVNSLFCAGNVWSNTADNLVSMQFTALVADGFKAGTRIIILKSNNFTNGTPTGVITTPYIKGSWVRVGSSVLGSAATTVNFTGLDGDRDVLYYMSIAAKGGSASETHMSTTLNGSNAYGYQRIQAINTTVSGERSTQTAMYSSFDTLANTEYRHVGLLLFAKKGFIRPSIIWSADAISGTTVTYINSIGWSWNNTADTLTSIENVASQANGFAAGSQVDLYALRPNG
jgi:hypothetical protein